MGLERVFELLRDENTEVVQTHISVVFIKRDVVYKVKKPVNFGFVDFSTLEKRRFYCEEEVRLNRRLCPDMYLGVEPIEDGGVVIEYAVKMRPLPMERSLKNMVKRKAVEGQHIQRVVEKIANFHKTAETNPQIQEFGRVRNFRRNTDENFEQTERFVGSTIDRETFDFVKAQTERFYTLHGDLLDRRAEQGFVRDCHGDLHCDHIVLADGVCIFDCIEFNQRFRFIDIACDIAFLLMDLDYLGARELAALAQRLYADIMGDSDLELLLPFFKCYRAYVRGKVNSLMGVDENITEAQRERHREEARRYFELAREYACQW